MYPPPKKSLGQNFLKDKNILNKIVSSCSLSAKDTVLEIGAGKGEMTKSIAARARKVYAVEIDRRLVPILEEEFKDFPNIDLINQDILKINLKRISPKVGLTVIGNIPYYISTPIISRIIESRLIIKEAYLTVQKEFAERVCAQAGSKEYGSLSCYVQYYTEPEILFTISRSCFFPAPKVDSAFLRLLPKKKLALGPKKEKELFRVIRSAFNKRRKTLRNSLKDVLSKEHLESFFKRNSLDPNIRPEELSLSDFLDLVK